MSSIIEDFINEYNRFKVIGQKAIGQVPDQSLNLIIGRDNNSISMIVCHISGNLVSRFTDFLTTDGEKPWRNRDSEFAEANYSRKEIDEIWAKGWATLEAQLASLSDDDLEKKIFIRGQPHTVHQALARSLSHTSYHIGQIVILARIIRDGEWDWISIPKGKSNEYNRNPLKEKEP